MLVTCKELAEKKLQEVKLRVKQYIKYYKQKPSLIIYANSKDAGGVYVRNKLNKAKEVDIDCVVYDLPKTPSELDSKLMEYYFEWEQAPSVIVQMPAYENEWDNFCVVQNLLPEMDADGLCKDARVLPATAKGILDLMEVNNLIKDGNTIVVIGRSKLVGLPVLTNLIQARNMNVISLNSKTKPEDLKKFCLQANVIVSAAGVPELITKDMVNPGTTILDVGINRDKEGKLCGDVAKDVAEIADVTPVPGGIGLLTVACLMENVCSLHGV